MSLSDADVERIADAIARKLGRTEHTVSIRTLRNAAGQNLRIALEGEGDHQLNPGTAGDD